MVKQTALVVLVLVVCASADKRMRIYNTDGTTPAYLVSAIDSIKFETIAPAAPAGMKLIPASGQSFQMGSNYDSTDWGLTCEKPIHTVSFTYDFWMDSTEVTQLTYQTVMTGASLPVPTWSTYGTGDSFPAYNVSWADCIRYCNARTKLEGSTDTVYTYTGVGAASETGLVGLRSDMTRTGYRLPTEAEWEYACRAGSTTDYFWGSTMNTAYDVIGQYTDGGYAQHVARKLPNAFGLYDMSGNIWEFVWDWYDATYYARSSAVDPLGPDTSVVNCCYYHGGSTLACGTGKAIRGSGWGNGDFRHRSAQRAWVCPGCSGGNVGFRVVRTVR